MIRVQWDEKKYNEFVAGLADTRMRLADWNKAGVWQAVSDILTDEFRNVFARQGAYNGPTWARLAPKTIRNRTRLKQTPIHIGWATGRMGQSLISTTNTASYERRDPLVYERGTKANRNSHSYPLTFAMGRTKRGTQPARPIAGRIFASRSTPGYLRLVAAIENKLVASQRPGGAKK